MTGNAERACPDADLRSLGIVQLIVRIENIYVMPVFFFYAFSVKNTLTLTAGRLQIRNFSAEVRFVCRAKLCHRRKRTDFNRPVGSGMVALQFLCAVMCLRCVCSLLLFRLFLCFMLRQSRFCFRGSGRIQQSQKRFEAGGVYKFLRHRIRYKPDGNTSGVLLRNRTFAKLAVPDTLSDEAHSQNLYSLMLRLFI